MFKLFFLEIYRLVYISILTSILFFCTTVNTYSQSKELKWSTDGNSYYSLQKNEIVQITLPENESRVLVSNDQLKPEGSSNSLKISYFTVSEDQQKILLFTKTKKVWRLNTRGDYWVYDLNNKSLSQLGKTLPSSSLMFAKFSPNCESVAYVCNNNIYAENLKTNEIEALTTNGSNTLINGTFDWVYEEEFFCRDGFRWSPDSRSIAFWQIDAKSIKKFFMINNTDSVYSQIIPVEYPKAGEKPSSCKVGVVSIQDKKIRWLEIPGDPDQNYIVRMEFIPATDNILVQQLNRKQNLSRLYICESSEHSKIFYEETDDAWIDLYQPGNTYSIGYTNKFIWLNGNKGILWPSEKDGWRHFYQLTFDNKPEKLITKGNFDVIELKYTDELNGYLYYIASPENATQKYLYRCKLNGNGKSELISPQTMKGTHDYSFSPNGKFALHSFSNHYTKPSREFLYMPDNIPLNEKESILSNLQSLEEKPAVEFFKIKTEENTEMDAWMIKPHDFNPEMKYPVVFYVYSEPASATVTDVYGNAQNFLYAGDMSEDGYIQISIDNRGTPVPKGRAWRKSIYKKIGQLNIKDQAMAAKEIFKWDFVDKERIAVWGWSGGGTATLNLMFQYPDMYKTGVAIAPLSDLRLYDNIYQERYMGLPQENPQDYIYGSPVTHAGNLEGKLLLVHGTGDDNVHFQNSEILVNELIKHGKIFQFMPYPNRTHNISEGPGTFEHLVKLYTLFIRENCPPGGKNK
ncbi:MAG: DPP IV N-terminal domain-containing protein [Saprospiraceae bacterium]|nr:DPP IV N-terminal domain-containing protein [Saprospiraceae bacterium]